MAEQQQHLLAVEPFSRKAAMDDTGLSAIPILNGTNYTLWERKMVIFLRARELLVVCQQKQITPISEVIQAKHDCAIGHISATIDDAIHNSVFSSTVADPTPYDVWTRIKEDYAAESSYHLCKVWEDWVALTYDSTLMKYLDAVLTVLGEFKTVGMDTTHKLFCCAIISNVNKVKRSLMETIMVDSSLLENPYLLLAKLRPHATYELSTLGAQGSSSSKQNSSTSALSTKGSTSKGVSRPRVQCKNGTHDPRNTHNKAKCWELYPELDPRRNKRARTEGANVSATSNSTTLNSNNNDDHQNSKNDQHVAPSFHYCHTTSLAASTAKLTTVLDSGASHHMLNTLDYFVETKPVHIYIVTGDGKSREELIATRQGTVLVRFSNNKIITLKDALFVPNLTRNLISLTQLLDEKIIIQRDKNDYSVTLNDNEKLFHVDITNNLFEIRGDISPVPYEAVAMINETKQSDGFTKWHNRLGHASAERIKSVIPAGEHLIKDNSCDTCMKGKMTRKKFNSHFDETTASLEVVHGDLVGPISPSSNGGARYFLTLVDQHTGYISGVHDQPSSGSFNATSASAGTAALLKSKTQLS
ncbi:hypothetical protein MJO28_009878 [Puccinia striiformis f. sp. tritici]|uniref:Uncharacterized protein n=1 Tax=Puccinia striiformis f. sp. tritici TaxID=168172 RepID=A0ACC0E8A0_9BASI|nr:hypothetical protein MJO28_009878 [Puccinia striiformis f. sp. tritici]KAI7950974.1 hypothetical protein MJO29_009648 [Puccinia striiformis f. sp. tritici]